MIKRTLYFGNPAYLSLKDEQLVARFLDEKRDDVSIPIEDIGILVLDEKRITLTQALLSKLLENTVAVVSCDSSHLPNGLFLPLVGNCTQTQTFRTHAGISEPLKKQIWRQTVYAKIENQTILLESESIDAGPIKRLLGEIKSGDVTNCEGQAAIYYWKNIFPEIKNFLRDRGGAPPNHLLNYGYAILRTIMARAVVCAGLHPTLGVFHRNKYNPYCLADDLMEPYRPFVDKAVLEIIAKNDSIAEITKSMKGRLYGLAIEDVKMNGNTRPLMIAVQQTANSFVRMISGESRKMDFPKMSRYAKIKR